MKKKRRESPSLRKYISDHEAGVLMPHLYSSITELKLCFSSLKDICDTHMGDITFGTALIKAVYPPIIQQQFPGPGGMPAPADLANYYFSATKKMLQESYIDPIDTFLEKHREHNQYELIADFLIFAKDLSFLASIILDIRDKFLMYSLQTWIAIHDPQTQQLISLTPTEAAVIAMPFKVTGLNIVGIAEAIRKNIENWQKEMLEARTYYLSRNASQWAIGANILTIVTAVSISFFFFRIPSFEEKLKNEETIKQLRNERTSNLNEITKLKVQLVGTNKKFVH